MVEVLGGDYEHTLTLSGEVDGIAIRYRPTPAPEIYRRVFSGNAFEVCEFSMAGVVIMHEQGRRDLVPVPVFPNRAFRHDAILVAAGSPVQRPAELKGKRIGVPDYAMTAAVWARALLVERGLALGEVEWVVSGRQRFDPPAGIAIIQAEGDLEDLLVAGEIAALIHPHPRDALRPPSARLTRPLLPDPQALARRFHRETGIYPINHTVVVHRDALARVPALAAMVRARYEAAKADALRRRVGATFLPFGPANWHDMLAAFDGDPLPYGLTPANLCTLDVLGQHLVQQRLVREMPEMEGLFAGGEDTMPAHLRRTP